jgi:hypothetical protein
MVLPLDSTMTDTAADEVFEITDKNYQRISENVEKVKSTRISLFFFFVNDGTIFCRLQEGYREGINDGRDSVFQQSFDKGYEDGFRIGFLLGKSQKEKASRGDCGLCGNSDLLAQPETEIRELHRKNYDQASN